MFFNPWFNNGWNGFFPDGGWGGPGFFGPRRFWGPRGGFIGPRRLFFKRRFW